MRHFSTVSSHAWRIFILPISGIIAVGLIGTTFALVLLYNVAVEEERYRLRELTQSQARLIEAVAQFDAQYSSDFPGGARAATISQIISSHENFEGVGGTGEFTIAEKKGDQIQFVLTHRHSDLEIPKPVPMNSSHAEPMRRALRGESGTLVGLDYRGEKVLAAYEPVAILNLGIVAKIDVSEVRAPFLHAGLTALLLTSALIILTIAALRRTTAPFLLELDLQKHTLDQHAIVSIANAQGNITYVNDKFCEISGYSRNELIGQNHRIVKSGNHDKDFYQQMWGTITKGEVWHGEFENLTKGNKSYWVDATIVPFRGKNGKPFQYVGIRNDITDRKEAEALIKQQAERLVISQEIARVGSWDWNIQTGELYWTKEIFNIFGRSSDDFGATYENFLECIHPEDRNDVTNAVQAVLEHNTPYDIEHRIVLPDGSVGHVHERGKVYRDSSGQAIRMLGVVHDITDRKVLEKSKSEFISTVSHELRTPLTSIKGSLGLILGGALGDLSDPMKKMMSIATQNTDRLINLVNDILDMEKLQAGKMEVHFENHDLAEVVIEAVQGNQGFALEHKALVRVEEPLPSVSVQFDKNRILQVLTNLISNAIKFSPDGGVVRVSVQKHENTAQVLVSDAGLGIPETFRDKIFERFTQNESTDNRQKGGTGLGLSICKAIVDLHDGDIGYETELGKGSTFWFELPRVEQSTEAS